MLNALPLIGIMVIVYNVMAFGGGVFGIGEEGIAAFLTNPDWLKINLVSGAWSLTPGDLIVTLTLFALFFEIIKATQTNHISIINHGLSMLVFVVALVEFIVLPGFATSTFFLITMMALVDVMAGFTVSIVTARRDIGADGGLFGSG